MADSEVVLLEDHQCVVRRGDDVFFIAVASQDEVSVRRVQPAQHVLYLASALPSVGAPAFIAE